MGNYECSKSGQNEPVESLRWLTSAMCCSSDTPRSSRQLARGLDHERRLVAFAAFGDGREIGRVGFDQDAIGGGDARGFLNFYAFGNVRMPPKLRWKPRSSACCACSGSAGEAVHDAA